MVENLAIDCGAGCKSWVCHVIYLSLSKEQKAQSGFFEVNGTPLFCSLQ